MIKSGRYGQVKYDPAGGGDPLDLVVVANLNKWKLSQKTDKLNVTVFGNANKVYVPGMPDMSGTVGGFWDKDDRTLFAAANAPTPGLLELIPNSTEPTYLWKGLAYIDAEVDTGAEGVPTLSGEWMAAGSWTMEPALT